MVLLAFSACSPYSEGYQRCYRYYSHKKPGKRMCPTDTFVIFLVDARHLDYCNTQSLVKSMAKHPSDGSKNTDVGHAWIYIKDEDRVFEGGVTAETGRIQPKYLHGVSYLSACGDPNPARYFFCPQRDGHLELGSGGHKPTYAAKVNATPEQVDQIFELIESYPYSDYALSGRSCASFVAEVAAILGIELEVRQTIQIDPVVCFRGERAVMWTDPKYGVISIATADRLERSLVELVESGDAEDALPWWKLR